MFRDRSEAGRELAEKLKPYAKERPLVLALPRGGVPVAYEVARALRAPLDTLVIMKVGAPFSPEFGVGAVGPGGILAYNETALQELGLKEEDLEATITAQIREMERRIEAYASGSYSKNLLSRTVILVDDGLATGVSALAAVEAAKIVHQPEKIIFAAPVCASEPAARLCRVADEVVCLQEDPSFLAVGDYYQNFPQVTDEEVIRLLRS